MPQNADDWTPLTRAKAPFYVGVDLGGTNIKAGLVDDEGNTLAYHTEPTHASRGPEDAAARMGRAVGVVASLAGMAVTDVAAVGLGTPGTQDLEAGTILRAGNLPGWDNFPIRDRVAFHCGHPVTYANDAGAAAYGEFWVGCGRELSSMLLWTLGTGVGSGIIVGEMSIEGAHSHGAECGHIIVDPSPSARPCTCGHTGHLEAYASATGLVARAREAVADGVNSSLVDAAATGEPLTPIVIARHAAAGDAFAMELVIETARWLAIGTVTVMHAIDPEGVVIGGAMTFGGDASPVGRTFLEQVRRDVRSRTFPLLAERTSIRYATLGGDAGYIGAAGLARLARRRPH